ncbi:MAG: hypothetical protein WC729_05385 [Sphingomonas sp.]
MIERPIRRFLRLEPRRTGMLKTMIASFAVTATILAFALPMVAA